MYLATLTSGQTKHYEIRRSLAGKDHRYLDYKMVFDLGDDPCRYIEHLTDDICYFSEELVERLQLETSADVSLTLEDLLWDFLPAEEQARLGIFRHRGRARVTALSEEERQTIEKDIHLFDRRRLYYLRYGAVDQSRIFRLNPKLYRPLLNKCRDEREFYLMDLEKALQHNELKTYVFAIFDLQRYFNEGFSATMPEALDQIDIADYFIEEICSLNNDKSFWRKGDGGASLHDHLTRYVIMFFDHGYGRRSLFDDFVREFMGRNRAFSWPDKKPEVSTGLAEKVFQMKWQKLQKMNRRELTRLYRERAKELHPDSGGNHEEFVELNGAYASLLARKKSHK
ncbi:MAG: hypothetical protein HKP52_05275 [Desulfofustis sp.]|nr:hypothetical protein [Desulfofustis sp.]NNK13631.1 hypothetical protein [Desulfofustis sp.]